MNLPSPNVHLSQESPSDIQSVRVIIVPERIAADDFALRLTKEAMSWVGTPFAHQQKLKQVGADCVHFIDECFLNIGVNTGDLPKDYSPEEDGTLILAMLENSVLQFVPTENRSPADVVAFCDEALREKDKITHIAFVTERTDITTFIVEMGRRGCVRHRLNNWWNMRIHSCWRYPVGVAPRI